MKIDLQLSEVAFQRHGIALTGKVRADPDTEETGGDWQAERVFLRRAQRSVSTGCWPRAQACQFYSPTAQGSHLDR